MAKDLNGHITKKEIVMANRHIKSCLTLPYFAVYNVHTHVVGPNFQGKKSFILIF